MFKAIDLKKSTAVLGLLTVAAMCGLAFLAISVLEVQGVFAQENRWAYEALVYSPQSLAFYFSRFVADLYYPLALLLLVISWLFYRRGRRVEALLVFATGLGWIFVEFMLKPFFHVACPPQYFANIRNDLGVFQFSWARYLANQDTCFPSSHTSSYTLFFGYLAFLSWRELKGFWRNTATFLSLLVVATVGLSRLILHVHWFSDVVAGYAIGLAMLLMLIAASLYISEKANG